MEKATESVKWLRVLTGIGIVSLVNSAVGYIPFVHGDITTWISRGIMLAMVYCMLRLAPVNGRYRKAGIFRAGMLACALITSFLFGSMLLTVAASVFSFLAVYQEFQAHAELVFGNDPRLSRSWRSLFWWEILVGLLLSLGSTVTVTVLMMSQWQGDVSRVSNIVILLLQIPRFVISVIYLLNLKKTMECVSACGK